MQLRLVTEADFAASTSHLTSEPGVLHAMAQQDLSARFSSIPVFHRDSLSSALQEDRLYVADYSSLSELADGNLPGAANDKALYAPVALFCVPVVPSGACATPLPVAIHDVITGRTTFASTCDSRRSSNVQNREHSTNEQANTDSHQETGNQYYSPSDDDWNIAKLKVQVADAFVHETVHHFARTHLLMEAVVCATRRTLDPCHPVLALLAPHFEGTAFINSTSLTQLLHDGGTIDRLTAPPVAATRAYAARSLLTSSSASASSSIGFSFEDEMPDVALRRRGVTNPSLCFPYRDDALKLWDALLQFVDAVLGDVHYPDDAAVTRDDALQAWARELCWSGRVTGFGERTDGSIRTQRYLVRAVAFMIFTASVQHAAVNFPQVSHMQFAPAMPLAGNLSSRDGGSESSGKRGDVEHGKLVDLLPSTDDAQLQLCTAQMLGVVRHTRLGQYDRAVVRGVAGRKGLAALDRLQVALDGIGKEVSGRNRAEEAAGLTAYDFLKPDLIPQSINI